jgi:hypothetical protein
MKHTLRATSVTLLIASSVHADVLFSNGTVITDPSGGTGTIAGQPISVADPYTTSTGGTASSLGFAATYATNTAAADNFVVPASTGGWDLDAVTLYAYQSGQTSPSITTIRLNLWTAAPYSAGSPPPVPDPLPQPVLAERLVLPAGAGTFVAHRESYSSSGTYSTTRPVFAYTVSLNGLPGGGVLPPGEYWLEWTFEGATSPSQNVFMPLVSPRTTAFDHNARLLNSIDGSAAGPRVWFEGREGYVAGVSEGRAYGLPFELHGNAIPLPPACYANCDASTAAPALNVADFTCFLQKFAGADPYANCDGSTTAPSLNVADFTCFLQKYAAGCP